MSAAAVRPLRDRMERAGRLAVETASLDERGLIELAERRLALHEADLVSETTNFEDDGPT